jgi:hydrogenase-1 operon protein HyaE
MTHPALQRLTDRHGLPVVGQETLSAWLDAHEHTLLFFAGDLDRFPESSDVAVILPELLKHFGGAIVGALVDAGAEKELQARYRFDAWPALVLLKRGQYLGVITRIRSWADYVAELSSLLASDPKPLPGFRIPVVSEHTDPCH